MLVARVLSSRTWASSKACFSMLSRAITPKIRSPAGIGTPSQDSLRRPVRMAPAVCRSVSEPMLSGTRDRITFVVSPSPKGKAIDSLRTPPSIP